MSLITMGYGHLTILTMGLGNGIRIVKQRYTHVEQYGTVEFHDISTEMTVEEITPEAEFEDERKKVSTIRYRN